MAFSVLIDDEDVSEYIWRYEVDEHEVRLTFKENVPGRAVNVVFLPRYEADLPFKLLLDGFEFGTYRLTECWPITGVAGDLGHMIYRMEEVKDGSQSA